jgi:hypothetical protein
MNKKTTNMTSNTTTNMTTNTELGQEQPDPQLAEHVVREVRGVHPQINTLQVLELTPEFSPR